MSVNKYQKYKKHFAWNFAGPLFLPSRPHINNAQYKKLIVKTINKFALWSRPTPLDVDVGSWQANGA